MNSRSTAIVKRAVQCLNDATMMLRSGFEFAARKHAVESLAYSIGTAHPDYLRAERMVESDRFQLYALNQNGLVVHAGTRSGPEPYTQERAEREESAWENDHPEKRGTVVKVCIEDRMCADNYEFHIQQPVAQL